MGFVHLHTHSHYSLLDGLSKIDELVSAAKSMKMESLALTDHGSMYGAIEFYLACKKAGIKPIIGMEGYLARGKRTDHESDGGKRSYHLTLLAKNRAGYQNLIKLTSRAHLEGYYYKPRFDRELLQQYHEGLVVLSGCMNGPISQSILDGDEKQLNDWLDFFQAVFEDDFYFEVQHRPEIPELQKVNARIKQLSSERGILRVAANDSHYIHPEDAEAQDIQLCIHLKKKLTDTDRLSMMGQDCSLASEEAMRMKFRDEPTLCDATVEIANKCDLELEFGTYHIPQFQTPEGTTPNRFLKQLCVEGLKQRFEIDYDVPTESDRMILDRLDYELSVIERMGFASYFLIVQDFVNWAKRNGIVVGPGRGSAAGSIVSYLCNITNIDPLKYDLLFERFLNPERISMPDIDLDFADSRREEVIEYVAQKYGRENVAQIITFGTMAARAAVRDVGRVMSLSYGFCDRVAKMIPMFTSLEGALANVPELKSLYAEDPEARRLLDYAKKLEGVARHTSTHACGVVITPKPLTEYLPIQHASTSDDSIITQYSLNPIEKLGLLKMDFLGLKNLTIIENALYIIEKTIGVSVDMDHIPLDDPKTFKLLQRAETTGVFQLESAGMRRYLKQLKPTEIEDIIAMVSLYRPGPMEFIPDYIEGKHRRKTPVYLHPKLQPILEKTYGIAVYQEQLMQIARDLAGFTYGQADVLRKAVAKKIKELLDEQEEKMISGMVKNNISRSTAEKIWGFILPFARYGFPRAHGACYAMIAYHTAYLKANYPAQFMAALLTSDQDNTDRIAIEFAECRHMGMSVSPPDVNESYSTFTVVKESLSGPKPRIRFGLNAIKNVGEGVIRAIIDERTAHGPYQSLEDFLSRVDSKDLNKKSLEALAMSGSLDRFTERNAILGNMELILGFSRKLHQDRANGQTNLFGMLPVDATPKLLLEETKPAEISETLSWEKQLLGMYISDHPFRLLQEALQKTITPIGKITATHEKSAVIVGGVLTSVKKIVTKSQESMAFCRLEDATGGIELLVFPRLFSERPDLWVVDRLILASGTMSEKDDEPKILVNAGVELDPQHPDIAVRDIGMTNPNADRQITGYLTITIPPGLHREDLLEIKNLLSQHPGTVRVYLKISGETVATSLLSDYNERVHAAIEERCGHGQITFTPKRT
ncbi:MAG: DNA polymerase III subunit alpha [Candidatus Kerfeldbacteria bacterium]|nr:DNA polymerase III subunit alpha [Candidatus Kerfeldbacteria bacterium]